jgi:glycosyltransferase involved in cell wall biosynthesis
MGDEARIEILLATFNGERFIRPQIESILGQDYDNLAVLSRDDCSTDGTPHILREYAQRFPNRFSVMPASSGNQGLLSNFSALMRASTADYVCFSDQDDVWLHYKVSRTKRAMDELETRWGTNVPLLIFTNLRVVDENLTTLHPSFWELMRINPEGIEDLAQLLGCSVVTGCTVMANRRLVELACKMPKEACLHDRWLGLLISTMGKAAFVKEPTMLYRQHGRNAIGAGKGQRSESLRERFGRSAAWSYIGEWQSNQEQAEALLKLHGAEMPVKCRKTLQAFLRCNTSGNRLVRVATFFMHRFYSGKAFSKIVIPYYLWSRKILWSGSAEG